MRRLCIVGGGLCGLAAAILARQRGWDITLFEQNTPSTYHGNAHFINAHSLHILECLGLDIRSLIAQATPLTYSGRMVYAYDLQNEIARVDLWKDTEYVREFTRAGPWGLHRNIPYKVLHHAMLQRLNTLGVDINWQHRVIGIDTHQQTLELMSTQGKLQHTWDYLLACDGARSTLARLLNWSYCTKQAGQCFVSCRIEADLRPYARSPGFLYWIYHSDIRACLVMQDIAKYQIVQIPIYSDYESGEDWSDQRIIHAIRTICVAPSLDVHIKEKKQWSMQTHYTRELQQGSLFLLGDAAHAYTPAGGLGLNTALADAYNLIWKLDTPAEISYTKERAPVIIQSYHDSQANYQDFLRVPQALGLLPQLGFLPAVWRKLMPHCVHDSDGPAYFVKLAYQLHKWRGGSELLRSAVADNAIHFAGIKQHRSSRYKSDWVESAEIAGDNAPATGEHMRFTHYTREHVNKSYKIPTNTWLLIAHSSPIMPLQGVCWINAYYVKYTCCIVEENSKGDDREISWQCTGYTIIRPDGVVAGHTKKWSSQWEQLLNRWGLI